MDRSQRRKLTDSELRRRLERNRQQKPEPTPAPVESFEPSQKEDPFQDTGIRIKNERHQIVITIPKDFVGKLNTFDLAQHLSLLTSPLFLQKDNQLKSQQYQEKL